MCNSLTLQSINWTSLDSITLPKTHFFLNVGLVLLHVPQKIHWGVFYWFQLFFCPTPLIQTHFRPELSRKKLFVLILCLVWKGLLSDSTEVTQHQLVGFFAKSVCQHQGQVGLKPNRRCTTSLFKHKRTKITPQFLYKSPEVSVSHTACRVNVCGREASTLCPSYQLLEVQIILLSEGSPPRTGLLQQLNRFFLRKTSTWCTGISTTTLQHGLKCISSFAFFSTSIYWN